MSNLLPLVLLGVVVLLTVGIYGFAHAPLPRHGPDRAGLEGFYLIVCPVRWLALALVLGIVIHRGGFGWLSRIASVAGLAVFALHAVAGVLSVCCLMGWRDGEPLVRVGAWVFAFVTPVVLMVVSLSVLLGPSGGDGAPVWTRGLLGLLALATAAGGVIGGREYLKERREAAARHLVFEQEEREQEARRQLEEQARVDAQLAEVKAQVAGANLARLIDFISDGSEAVREAGAQALASRPGLVAELAAMLQSDDRVRALKYVWWRMNPPPADLAQPLHDCVGSMPDWTRRELAVIDEAHATEVNWACEAIVILADRLGSAGPDYRPPIQQLSAFIEENFPFQGFRARDLLKGWLERHPRT